LDEKLIVAGMNPPQYIQKLARQYPNIDIVANPDDKKMFELIREAQVNILVTFQATGLKLKLLNTLYKGRFCLVNSKMLNGTGLDELCVIGENSSELKSRVIEILQQEFQDSEIIKRKAILNERYSNDKNAVKLINLVFENEDI